MMFRRICIYMRVPHNKLEFEMREHMADRAIVLPIGNKRCAGNADLAIQPRSPAGWWARRSCPPANPLRFAWSKARSHQAEPQRKPRLCAVACPPWRASPGNRSGVAEFERCTIITQRAQNAFGLARRADHRPEVHASLGKIARTISSQDLFNELMDLRFWHPAKAWQWPAAGSPPVPHCRRQQPLLH